MKRFDVADTAIAFFNLDEKDSESEFHFPGKKWIKTIESSSEKWCGQGEVSPDLAFGKLIIPQKKFSFTLYENGENI